MELDNLAYPIIGTILTTPYYLVETNPKFNQWDNFYDHLVIRKIKKL
jgi:hypothetical protein